MDSAKLQASLILHEGLRLFPYLDSEGKCTIGVGRNLTDRGISDAEAMLLLSNDIALCTSEAEAQPWWPMVAGCDARARAFIEILFNVGLGALAGFRKALAAAMQSDWDTCAAEFRNSEWFTQVGGAPGQRGYVLSEMIRTGNDPA